METTKSKIGNVLLFVVLLLCMYALLAGCDSEKRATKRLAVIELKHPGLVAKRCAEKYDNTDSVDRTSDYKPGAWQDSTGSQDLRNGDTLVVVMGDTVYIHITDTLIQYKDRWKVDTVIKQEYKRENNAAALDAAQIQFNKSRDSLSKEYNKMESSRDSYKSQSKVYFKWAIIVTALLVILAVLKFVFKIF